MDEPLSNLDAKLRGEMRTELKRLHADTNSTFIYVTHGELLSAVVFGSMDYPVDHPIKIDFIGGDIILFDKESTERIAIGKLTVI